MKALESYKLIIGKFTCETAATLLLSLTALGTQLLGCTEQNGHMPTP